MLNAAAHLDVDFEGDDWPGRIHLNQGVTIEHLDEFNNNISSLLDRPHMSDLTLVIEGQDVPVNRSILAARSEYFHALLYNGMKESRLDKVELPSIKLKPFKILLRYIYSGKLQLNNLSADDLSDLLITARIFCFNTMVCDISTYLRLLINKDNVWSLYKASKLYILDKLATTCERFFDKNAESILQHEDFIYLDTEDVCEMMKRNSFYAPEHIILKAICHYYTAKTKGSTNSKEDNALLLDKLLGSVRLSLLKPTEINAIFSEYQIPYLEQTRTSKSSSSSTATTNIPPHLTTANMIKAEKRSISTLVEEKTRQEYKRYMASLNKSRKRRTTTPTEYGLEYQENSKKFKATKELNFDECHDSEYNNNSLNSLNLQNNLQNSQVKHLKESIRGYLIYNKNIATRDYGVEPVKGRLKKDLVCCTDRNYTLRTCTNHTLPHPNTNREECIQIAFGRPFIVNNIRMLLLDDGQRSFSYTIEVSTDSRNWYKVADYTKYWCRSWQHIFFPERVVRHVRITGSRSRYYGITARQMFLVYFECMYNSIDSRMYKLSHTSESINHDSLLFNIIEPKSSIVDSSNTIAFSSSSSVGSTRHFRLRSSKPSSTSSTSSASQLSTPPHPVHSPESSSTTNYNSSTVDSSVNGPSDNDSSSLTTLYPGTYYRVTDFARGSVNWMSPGKVTFQLAQPFMLNSFAFKIVPVGSEASCYTYSINLTNDLEAGPWKPVRQVKRMVNDLFVVKFEPQIVTFIEIRTIDYPTLSQFSIRHFECPYISA